ncbi:MAG: glycoside hydrolase family 2 TIM barrel-domain containing protein [Bacteroidales bacterium]|nr:glycoside hydrolase family 2 TIM barrel-domain containing protein [Bacteroidales bacterium]
MNTKYIISTLLVISFFTQSLQIQAQYSTRLIENWKFLRSDIGGIWEAVRPVKEGNPESVPMWQSVSLPHCFNATDAVDPDVNYYQGPGWYTNKIEIKNPYSEGRTLLHFEGAGQKTDVYVYTTKVGSHTGGYDEWSVDITDAIQDFQKNKKISDSYRGRIPIEIRCDNSRDLEMIPSDLSDFNVYGGIYRYLNLVYQPALAFERIKLSPSVDAKGIVGNLDVRLNFANKSALTKAKVRVEIADPKGKIILSKDQDIFDFNSVKEILTTSIKKPKLWSPIQPSLYCCKVTLTSAAGEQTMTEKFGFRNTQFVEKGPFMLNGSRLLLRGTHRHEDHAGVGAAMTEAQIRQEMQLIKEMGVNFIRLGHYQQSRIVLQLCDSLGILVWEEIPWCRGGLGGETYQNQARSMMTNMINQHFNHPSIILLGLGNENDWSGDFSTFDNHKIRDFMTELNNIAHKMDPTRMTSIRRCDFCKDIPDVYSPSIWAGWYRGIYTEYKDMTNKEINGVNRFFHAEWGGDSHAGRHSETPDKGLQGIKTGQGVDERAGDAALIGGSARVSKDGDWSESYICNLFDWHLKEQENMPNLTGSAAWVFKDFSTPVRPDNPVPYVNQKGVVERDFTKKEAYYVFQSYWTEKPMVHIYGHSWPIRWGGVGEEKMIKVYSNCDDAELFLNGISLGIKKRNSQDFPAAGLRWNAIYQNGNNEIKVVARKGKTVVTDQISQAYQSEKWGNPAQLSLKKIKQQGDTITIETRLMDTKQVLCLSARNVVTFGLTGDGKLIDNQGTSSGSRKVELQNGRATIKVVLQGGKSVSSVKCNGIATVFCEL